MDDQDEIWHLATLPPVVLAQLVPHLSCSDLAIAQSTSSRMREAFNDPFIWGEYIRINYGPSYLALNEDLKTLAHKLKFSRVPVSKINIINGEYWKIKPDRLDSDFGSVACLIQVCWLELHVTVPVLPGCYDIIWRLNFPSKSAINFDADWTAQPLQDEEPVGICSEFKHGHNTAPFLVPCVANGWTQITVGRVIVPPEANNLKVRVLGGNPHWFRDLEVDWVEIRPCSQEEPAPVIPVVIQEEKARLEEVARKKAEEELEPPVFQNKDRTFFFWPRSPPIP